MAVEKKPKLEVLRKPLIAPPGWPHIEPLIAKRIEHGFSIGELAAAMALDYSRLLRIERGQTAFGEALPDRYKNALEALIRARADRGE